MLVTLEVHIFCGNLKYEWNWDVTRLFLKMKIKMELK